MKNWIEVTDLTTKEPYLINLIFIEYIEGSILHTGEDGEFCVLETYEEIKQKIVEAM